MSVIQTESQKEHFWRLLFGIKGGCFGSKNQTNSNEIFYFVIKDVDLYFQLEEKQKSPGSTGEQGLLGALLTRLETVENLMLADQAGFEPAEGLTPRTLSRRVT